MDTLRKLYTVVVQNIRKAREKLPKKEDEPHNFKVNDMVLVKDPDAAVFEPRYQPNFRVTAIFGNNRIEVQDECGHKSIRRSAHVKYIEPSEKVVQQLPSEQVLKNYGRSLKLLLAAKDIPDFPEHSQNSLPNGEPKVDTGEANMSFGVRNGQCLVAASGFREVSSNSRVESECSQGTHHKQSAQSVCISEPSEFSRDSLGGVGSNVSVPKFSWLKSMSQIVGLTAAWLQSKVEGNPRGANTASNAKTNSNPVHTEFNFFL